MAGIPEALVALLLSTLDPGMTKQVLKVEVEVEVEVGEGGKREVVSLGCW